MKITPLFDQSGFVRAAISGVVREAVIAALLTAMLILVFLGNWRSTCIIAVSIPLSILSSIIALYIVGETLNIMTLGGLALAVGILVDDATVTIENIERHMHMGSDLHKAILDGAGEIAIPALVSTLCICIVFVPMFFLTGVARYLFAPLAEAVVFAMLASYVLSRTLVPTLVMLLMDHTPAHATERPSLLQRVYRAFNARFEKMRGRLQRHSRGGARAAAPFRRRIPGFLRAVLRSGVHPGQGFLSERGRRSDSPAHAYAHRNAHRGDRAGGGSRWRPSSARSFRGLNWARCSTISACPVSGINKTYSNAGTFGTLDGEIQVSLNEGHRPDAALHRSRCAANCRGAFPAWSSSSSRPTWSRRF